jgi:hypothetical protein
MVEVRRFKTARRLLPPAYLVACCLALPLIHWVDAERDSTRVRPRRLVLILDGVPHSTIEELRAEGRFKSFRAPARLISTFPSLTNPSMIEILGAPATPGYEDHYYDRAHDRLVGGFQDRVRGGRFIRGTFREQFNYHAPALQGSFAYLAQPLGAVIIAQADLASFRRAFRRAHAPVFVGYLGATDSLAHLGGEGLLKSLLRSLDRTLDELQKESKGALEIELLSDHGNHFTGHKHVKLNEALERAGFKIEKSLARPRSVVLPRYGLVGSAVLFTAPENRTAVAAAAAATEGVDFAVYQAIGEEGRVITMAGKRGRARVERRGDRYRYELVEGDPLALRAALDALEARGEVDSEGFAHREAWMNATREHRYVDPLRRLFTGFGEGVRSTGDVIVSFEDGYLIGSPFFGAFALMRATHGNLQRPETEGFAMSTRQDLGEVVRGFELRRLFELDRGERVSTYAGAGGHCEAGPQLALALARNRGLAK